MCTDDPSACASTCSDGQKVNGMLTGTLINTWGSRGFMGTWNDLEGPFACSAGPWLDMRINGGDDTYSFVCYTNSTVGSCSRALVFALVFALS